MRPVPSTVVAALVALLAAAAAAPAGGAQQLALNARDVEFAVNKRGVAAVSYTTPAGRRKHALVWGAVNAIAPHPEKRQVRFRVNYAGGYGTKFGAGYWKKVRRGDRCGRYRGPRLPRLVLACTTPNGIHWALQKWRRLLPNLGWEPRPGRGAVELHVSRWRGELPVLWLKADWSYAGAPKGPFDHLYGQFLYRGEPVVGFEARNGEPADSFGRLIFLDTHDPPWRKGYRQRNDWWRQNSFLTRQPRAHFCPGIHGTVHGARSRGRPGRGDRYRATASGPGVTPIVQWIGPPPGYYVPGLANREATRDERGPYDPELDRRLDVDQERLAGEPRSPASCGRTP